MKTSSFTAALSIALFLGLTLPYYAQSPHTHGQWSPKIEFDLVPVAVANLPDGRLVTWSSKYHDDFGGDDGYTFTQIFDPLGGPDGVGGILPRTVTDTNHDMFCPGINNLADGRILVTGGSSAEKSSIYDPKTQKWTSAADLNIPRGYQGAVTLSDGSAFTIGGSWSGDATYGGRDAEIWTEATGWTRLTGLPGELLWNANDFVGEDEGEYRLDNHAWLWAAPNGKIFHAGPGEEMHWIDVNGVGSYAPAGPYGKRLDDHESMNGNTAMFDVGKILKVGGSRSYSSDTPSNDKSYVIDINNNDVVTVTPTANKMANSRIYVTSVVLPNGEVLVMGGMERSVVFSDNDSHLSAEMYDPISNSFRLLASMTVPRTYHSAGILLNDGRVFMGGGGLCGTCGDVNHTDAEIYSPPYLFDANGDLAVRPILNAPDKAFYGRQLTVNATPGIQEFSFMRMSSATHSVNNEQRRVPVDFAPNNGTYVLDIPNANLMPPGYYMLFAIKDGVPSISEAVLVGAPDPRINGNNLLVEFDFFEGSGTLVMDTSGNENHGTIKQRDNDGAPTGLSREYWSTEGLSGNALEMDGIEHQSNTILEIPYTSTLPSNLTDQITVMAWVNRNSGSVVLGTNKVPNVSIFSHDYPRSFFMGYHDSQFKTEFRTSTGGHVNGYTEVLYKPGEWQHFVSTYDGNWARVYVDGVQIFQQEVSGDLLITNENNEFSTFTLSGFYDRRTEGIGTTETLPENANRSGITDELDGRMDKFKLYNIALTAQEIQRIYNEERKIVVNEDPCDDVSLVYDINGKKDHGLKEIVVSEGDNIELSLKLEDADYAITSVTYGENNVPSSSIITGITSAQTGTYKVNYALKKVSMASILVVRAADSEMGEPNPRPMISAVDRNPQSHWHTKWGANGNDGVTDQLPHWIDLDLGEEFNVSGLEYLPRQDEDSHGTIADYEIYVSNSFAEGEWGDYVAKGTWTWNDRHAKMVNSNNNFTEKSGRYVRLLSTREVEGRPFTSAAEIRVELTENTFCEKEIQINVHTPITYTYDNGDWSSPGDPSGESTKFDNIIINEGQGAVISKNTLVNNLTINAGAALTVGTNVILTFNEITLNSTSTSYASLIDNGWIAATVNYNRHVNIMGTEAGGGNDLISSPVTGVIFDSDFVAANLNLAEHPDKNGIFAFAPFVVANNKYENFNIGLNKLGRIPIVPGSGYRVATANDSTLIFKGNITRNSVNVSISDEVAGRAWNLIGNPYPSYIDVEEFFTNNTSELQEEYVAIYGYKGVKDSWEIYNESTSGELIAPGQGFFVKAKSGGGTIRFTPSMRRIGSSDDFIEGRPTNINKALSKLKLSSASNNVTTRIYFIEGTTKGLDPGYDAAAYSATAIDFSIFTNLLEDDKGLDIAIQSLPYEDFNDVIVPLGIKAKAGTELSISIDELSTIPSHINVYLEDTQNNTLTLLNNADFTFKPTTDLNSADRFNVHYSSRTLSIGDMDVNDNLRIYITVVPKALVIRGQLTSATSANLYDIQGRLVLTKVLNSNSTENTMDISTLGTGVYVVKVNNDNQFKTQKVIIK